MTTKPDPYERAAGELAQWLGLRSQYRDKTAYEAGQRGLARILRAHFPGYFEMLGALKTISEDAKAGSYIRDLDGIADTADAAIKAAEGASDA